MKNKILERMHKIVAVSVMLFGVLALYLSMRDLKFGTIASPKEGMAPIVFSTGIILFSVPNLVLEWIKPNQIPEKLKDVNWFKWFVYLLICVAYVFLVKKIGFMADTFICLLAMLKLAGLKGWLRPVVITAVFTTLCWALFTFAMNIKLPAASWF